MSLSTTSNRPRLIAASLQLLLILFLITPHASCSPIQQRSEDSIDASELSGTPDLVSVTTRSTSASSSSNSSSFTFPTAFDTLGNNFTASSCPQFFADFLADDTYQSCHAVSLLLQNSNSFFKDLASATTTNEVLDIACTANVTTCTSFMAKLASNLTSSSNCGADYKLGNPVVTQAYDGMISYKPIATASCLNDPSTQEFCFTEAATNTSNSADYYLYLLPLGNSLPTGIQPTCTKCTQATMEVFLQAALVKGSSLAETYIPAAELINDGCGSGFVNATVDVGSQDPSSSSASARSMRMATPSTLLAYVVVVCLGLLSTL